MITPGLWLFTMLIEVPIAILANCGRTDDGQRAMTKAHLTEWAQMRACGLLSCIVIYRSKLKDVCFFLHKTKNFLNIGPSEYI